MSVGKLILVSLSLIIAGAILGAALGQLFPESGILYVVPTALAIGISIRLFANRLDKRDPR